MEPHPRLEKIALPQEMPVIMLSECFLFPGCMIPLFIFEERYRAMLKHALSESRMFCIGTRLEPGGEVMPVSTAGLIRACVTNEDGTSQLLLAGLHRIRFTGWKQEKPFGIARIEPMLTEKADGCDYASLKTEAISLLPSVERDDCDAMRLLREKLEKSADPEAACDLMTYHFVTRPAVLGTILSERSLTRRYELLMDALSAKA
jgi:ATP-dependent Lon protease